MRPGFDGLLIVDKPGGMTSRDVVNRAQRWFPLRTRIGHTGTLDPLATGVLVLCVGMATRLAEYVQRMSKVYAAGIRMGATSDTDDAEGRITPLPDARIPAQEAVRQALDGFLGAVEQVPPAYSAAKVTGRITPLPDARIPTQEAMRQALDGFVGAIDQVPPAYSAAKVTGRRAYDLARQGKVVTLDPRTVTIHAIDLLAYAYPNLDIIVRCGKGTYIRSLARDLGRQLGSGGYITSLRRLQVGCFREADAVGLDVEPVQARRRLLPVAHAVSELSRVTLNEADASRLLHGQRIAWPIAAAGEMAVFDEGGCLLAIAEVAEGLLHAKKVLVGTDAM